MNVALEREQLLGWWSRVLSGSWISKPRKAVSALADPANPDFGMSFRHAHDLFGWMAKGSVRQGGLCSGAIYRTERFMSIAQELRNGSAGPRRSLLHLQNVHIEHTVPVAILVQLWRNHLAKHSAADMRDVYAWLLLHSVTTAFHMGEKGGLGPYESTTDAFTPGHAHYALPFARYGHKADVPAIWNVFDGCRIDPEAVTFEKHLDVVLRLLEEAGCAGDVLARIAATAATEANSIALAGLSVTRGDDAAAA